MDENNFNYSGENTFQPEIPAQNDINTAPAETYATPVAPVETYAAPVAPVETYAAPVAPAETYASSVAPVQPYAPAAPIVPVENQYPVSYPEYMNMPAPVQPPKKKKTGLIVALALVFALIVGGVVCSYVFYFEPLSRYEDAEKDLRKGNYDDARYAFEELGSFKDSEELLKECDYREAKELMENGSYEKAIALFTKLGDYKESKEKCNECNYGLAEEYFYDEDYENAIKYYTAAGDYLDSADKLKESKYEQAVYLYEERSRHGDAIALLQEIPGYNNSEKLITEIEEDYFADLELYLIKPFILIANTESPFHEYTYTYLLALDSVSNNYSSAVNALYSGTSYYEGYSLIISSSTSQEFKKTMSSGQYLADNYDKYIELLSNPPAKYAGLYNTLAEAHTGFADYCDYIFYKTTDTPSEFKTKAENYFKVCEPYYAKIESEYELLSSDSQTT